MTTVLGWNFRSLTKTFTASQPESHNTIESKKPERTANIVPCSRAMRRGSKQINFILPLANRMAEPPDNEAT